MLKRTRTRHKMGVQSSDTCSFVRMPVFSVNSWSSTSTIGPAQLQTCPLESDKTSHYLFRADWCSLSRNNTAYGNKKTMIKQLFDASQISRLLADAHLSGRRFLPYGKQYEVMWAGFVNKTWTLLSMLTTSPRWVLRNHNSHCELLA